MLKFEEKRLDEMEFTEVSQRYSKIFSDIIWKTIFEKIEKLNFNKYKELQDLVNQKLSFKWWTLWRWAINYARNMLYWWFLEEIVLEILKKNKNIKNISFYWNDSKHNFFVNKDNKIEIYWSKTTDPDFLVKLNSWKEFLIELKSASKWIFTIKKWNVDQLSKSCAYSWKITIILMIDLLTWAYELKWLNFFKSQIPFVNQRMEWQLCYDFPTPEYLTNDLLTEWFDDLLDEDIFNDLFIKKLILLKKAEDSDNKKFKRIIKQKLRIEKLEEELNYHNSNIKQKIEEIKEKVPEVNKTWNEIEKEMQK